MKAQQLLEALQKLLAENPKAARNTVSIQWESDSGRGLERHLRTARFRVTNGLTPEIVLET